MYAQANLPARLVKIRKTINDGLAKANRIIKDLDHTFSFAEFRSLFVTDEHLRLSVHAAFDRCIARLNDSKRYGTADSYKSAQQAFHSFDSELKLTNITPSLLCDFEDFMVSLGRSVTTVGIYVRALRVIYNRAIDDGTISGDSYPFGPRSKRKYEIPKGNRTKKATGIETVRQIMDYVPKTAKMGFARDMWLFCFFCNGMNIGDVVFLKWRNIRGRELSFLRRKTIRTRRENAPIKVYLTDGALKILERRGRDESNPDGYVFFDIPEDIDEQSLYKRKMDITRSINRHMKTISRELGLDENLTTVTARHSYATILKNNAIPVAQISENLGHSSIAVTEHYLNSFSNRQVRETAELLENLLEKTHGTVAVSE